MVGLYGESISCYLIFRTTLRPLCVYSAMLFFGMVVLRFDTGQQIVIKNK